MSAYDVAPPSSRRRVGIRKKVLIADDSYTALLMMRMMLSGLPCDVVTVGNGRDAVERALVERPDLILMDVEMPCMSGIDACRHMRRSEATRGTPILLVTTRSQASDVRAGFECGCTGYVTKPINPEELLAKIRNYLGA